MMTTIRCTDGTIIQKDIRSMEFIPSSMFDEIFDLIAKDDEEKINMIYSSSAYDLRKKHVSKEKTKEFKYPVVRYMFKNIGEIDCYWSSINNKGQFGIPKVMFGIGAAAGLPTIDKDGKYAMCEFVAAIADEPENLNNIQKALVSDKFKKIMEACTVNRCEYNHKVIAQFRKDFWKEFI